MKYQENPSTTGQWDASEYVINRYAEVILARAEALNEIYGPTQEAKDLVHEIRERAFDNYKGSKYEKEINDITDKDAFRAPIKRKKLGVLLGRHASPRFDSSWRTNIQCHCSWQAYGRTQTHSICNTTIGNL